MNTMKRKNNFCNGHLYEIQKLQEKGGNNAYKIFLSEVEEGNIPNTISYMELFRNTMKMENNFCKGHQYEMQKSQDGGGNNAFKIFSSWVKEGNIPSTTSYMELFMTPMKMKNNFCDRRQYEMQKCHDGGGNNSYKIIMCQVDEGNIISKHNIFLVCIKVSTSKPLENTIHLFLVKPPLDGQTVQAPLFRQSSLYIGFSWSLLKVRIFSEPQKY